MLGPPRSAQTYIYIYIYFPSFTLIHHPWLVFRLVISPCLSLSRLMFFNSSPYLFFSSSPCIGFLSDISFDRCLSFFVSPRAPYIPFGHVVCLFILHDFCPCLVIVVTLCDDSRFLSVSFFPVSLFFFWMLWGSCGAPLAPLLVAMPARVKARECKSAAAENAWTPATQKTGPSLNQHLASFERVTHLVRETHEWKETSLFYFALTNGGHVSLSPFPIAS